jgi:hypothetical protein
MVGLTEFTVGSNGTVGENSEIYICCDICEETFVGGKEVSLLRRVVLGTEKGYNFIFTAPYYVPIKNTSLQQISIYITDREGNFISFLKAPVTVTLHFKKFAFVL